MRLPLTVVLITLNEEKNLSRALASVKDWADEIVVVDSGSTDHTIAIATQAGARVQTQTWLGYGQQKNFAQSLARNDWILSLDADEAVSEELKKEIEPFFISNTPDKMTLPLTTRGFDFPRKTFYLGRWIRRGGWYPNRAVRLAHRRFAQWTEPYVHEHWEVKGEVVSLQHPLLHYPFHGIQDQVLTNVKFSKLGSQELIRAGQKASLFKLLFKPIGKFIETYFIKLGFLDGLPGFVISVNAAHSIFLKYAYLFEPKK